MLILVTLLPGSPPQTVELPADLVFPARLYDFERAHAGTSGHVGGPPPPAEVPVRLRTGRATPRWLVRALPADCGAGAHDATPQENSGQVSKSPGPRSPTREWTLDGTLAEFHRAAPMGPLVFTP